MVHFFLTFGGDGSTSPFGLALKRLGVEHRVFCGEVLLRYRWRVWLLLIGLPKLAAFALQSAWRSLVRSRPLPDVVVLGSHLEALVFWALRAALRRDTRIFLLGFIYTRRTNPWHDRLRRVYFSSLFKRIDGILCHSTLEVQRYETLFAQARCKFTYVPYGLHIHGYESGLPAVHPANAPALAAGRSGRDYPTLFRAFERTGYPLRVVCDSEKALIGCARPSNIEILRHCYDGDYVRELQAAGMVVVPLSVGDISAGQMVLIQAMAFRKPLIVTRTPTVEDYLTHEVTALLVPPGDESALNEAVMRLRESPALAATLAANAFEAFKSIHCMDAFVEHVVRAVTSAQTRGPRRQACCD